MAVLELDKTILRKVGEAIGRFRMIRDGDRVAVGVSGGKDSVTLVEALRTMRLIHYAAWLARRWSDPAFPLNFPWFNSLRYWSDHILELREQMALLDDPPLQVY